MSAKATATIEGRVFFYNFDFFRFRAAAEESTRPFYPFLLQGVCYKFRFAGQIRVFVEGKPIIDLPADEIANGFTLPIPFQIKAGEHLCVYVTDTQPRWFRRFRRNTAHVTLEGLECAP